MSLPSGTRLGHFEIIQPLGAGGMGEVYRARDERLGREVAIKILPSELACNEQALLRFQREARSIAALSHPNILALYELDHDETSGLFFFASELLQGETLGMRLRQGAIGWKKAAEIAASIADGLSAAHAKGIIHRDLKPDNLFITSDGVVKVLDFGIARGPDETCVSGGDEETQQQVTHQGTVVGTIGYMSPEQVRGEALDVTTDLFSFGCVLYEMITGANPFRRGNSAETLAAILKDEPLPFDKRGIAVPADLDWIVQHCLEKRADQRFHSARDVAADLRRAISVSSVRPTAGHAIDSIAVLPFENTGGDPDAEYLSDGIAETIIAKLSQIPNVRVMARSTVFRFKNRGGDAQQIGAELDVRLVLHGRVSHRGDALTIRTELVKVADGTQLWGERYQRKAADLLDIEEEIAREIADQLRVRLTGDQKQLLSHRYTDDPAAYHAYLKGRFHWNKRSETSLNAAIGWFKEALEKDPTYALAYTGLADAYNLLGFYSLLAPRDAFPKAESMARKALELDGNLAEALASLGYVMLYYHWKWAEAETYLRKAIALKDAYTTAHLFYVNFLVARGRFDEAAAENRRALELDPLSMIDNCGTGWNAFYSRDYGRAVQTLRKALTIDDTFGQGHLWLSWALVKAGHFEEAIAEAKRGITAPRGEALASEGYVQAAAGKRDAAMAILTQLLEMSKERFVQPYYVAIIYTALGDAAQALDWLQRSVDLRSHYLVMLKVDPRFDEVRSHPQFAHIMEQVGL